MEEITSFNSITSLPRLKNVELNEGAGQFQVHNGKNFSAFLKDAINNLEQIQAEGNQASLALITGEVEDLHTPVIALEKANLSLSLAVTVRNKVINAYQEIMRMQI
ncbi:MAG: flagellar hook-basal body complex protein FliE [Bacillota bacterium]|jgi:flagellar hook-basal body complex protein FliE